MPTRRKVLSSLPVVLGLLTIAVLIGAPAVQAATTPWGQLGHFGDKGELRRPEAAFGVNPEDGSAWVVDTALVGKEEVFRLQQFREEGGSWKLAASRTIRAAESESEATLEVEGVAFDKTLHRAYVLIDEERTVDPGKEEDQAASELYAFASNPSGTEIAPAPGTTSTGLLVARTSETLKGSPVGKTKFAPEDKETGTALISPGGIAVNPLNDQILVTGWSAKEVPVVWAISKEGTIEGKWEDESKFFEKCGCLNSPVVTSTGRILALGEGGAEEPDEIYEIPSSLNSATPAKRAVWLPTSKFNCERLIEQKSTEPCPFLERLTVFDYNSGFSGGGLATGPEGSLFVHVKVPDEAEGENPFGAVMVFNSNLEEIGWTGGGSSSSASQACSVNETGADNGGNALIGGSGEKVLMFERGSASVEGQTKILALGAGGPTAGCPLGSATPPKATVGAQALSAFPVSDTITFSSTLTQANALSTEWEFEPGVTETIKKRQQETTSAEHKFAKEGEYTVIERIHSDDLATPTIETSVKVTILGPPKVRNEAATVEGAAATLAGEVNPNLKLVTKCEFQYAPVSEELGASSKKALCPKAAGEGSQFVAESVKVTGLQPSTKYHFRLFAESASGKSTPEVKEYETGEVGAPVAITGSATSLATTSATVNGQVNPEGTSTTCKFQYGTTTAYGKEAACATQPGSGTSSVAVTAPLSGLTANTTYHYRVVAENSKKQSAFGADKELKTTAEIIVVPPGPGPTTTTTTPQPPPQGEVKHEIAVKPVPTVTIAGSSLTIPANGVFGLKLSCPAGETQCTGTVVLKTLTAVAASSAHAAKAKKAILTLASASFSIAGGKLKVVSLRLSAKAKKLLAKMHTVRARVTVAAHDPQGGAHTTTAIATLRAAKKHH